MKLPRISAWYCGKDLLIKSLHMLQFFSENGGAMASYISHSVFNRSFRFPPINMVLVYISFVCLFDKLLNMDNAQPPCHY